ncbi:MAG: hypothetical protein HFH60_08185 [Lachnospiraceae bacterium]|nr:hypothetical protein [Lachnospiraceae bacterium]MCI9546644.1 hypothetical protein [Lachnospiraceae bacterium]
MYQYHFFQWILFFFIYCFFGWIWESCYVSVKGRKWVNRGFLHGPLIPIYGFGAIAVLFAAIPVRDNLALVYIFGMAGATLLEYVTGATMERIFKVRYWDYSGKFLNINGHVCLVASLAWGAFSVLMIRYVHAPVELAVTQMQADVAEVLAFALVLAFAVDATQSFNEAMDLREIIERITESSQELKRIQKRVDVIAAVIDADVQEHRKKAEEFKKTVEERLLAENRLQELSETIGEYLERARDKSTEAAHGIREEIDRMTGEMKRLQESLGRQQQKLGQVRNKQYMRSIGLLRRNPGASSRKYREALEELWQRSKRL